MARPIAIEGKGIGRVFPLSIMVRESIVESRVSVEAGRRTRPPSEGAREMPQEESGSEVAYCGRFQGEERREEDPGLESSCGEEDGESQLIATTEREIAEGQG